MEKNKKTSHIPMRRCIGCMESKPKETLIRMVVGESGPMIDRSGKAEGRGVYICSSEECLKKAIKKKSFNRVFREQIRERESEARLAILIEECSDICKGN